MRPLLSAAILLAAALAALASTASAQAPLGLSVDLEIGSETDATAGSNTTPLLSLEGTDLQLLGSPLLSSNDAAPQSDEPQSAPPSPPQTTQAADGTQEARPAVRQPKATLSGGDVVTPLVALGILLAISKGLFTSLALSAPGVGLFSRLKRNQMLDHPTRARLYDLVSANPGINMQTLSKDAGTGWGNTVYHLRRMLDAGLIASVKANGSRAFYLAGCETIAKTQAHQTLGRSQSEPISRFILANPGTTQKQIAQSLALSKAVVSKRIKNLAHSELVAVDRQGRETWLYPTGKLHEMLAPGAASAPQPTAAPEGAAPTA